MTGAVDALGIGTATISENERIVSCCRIFARLSGRSPEELVGTLIADLLERKDHRSGRWLMKALWSTGDSFTFLSSHQRPNAIALTVESRVTRLFGGEKPSALILSREFTCRTDGAELIFSADAADYVADMAGQLSGMAGDADMPVTCDLLHVSARAARLEAALPDKD